MLAKLVKFAGSSLARWLILGLFVVQTAVLAIITKGGVPPDETNHTRFIDFYAHHSLSPFFTNQTPTYNLGDKTREVGYLYHYLMSLIERALPFSAQVEHVIIRFISIGIVLLTFWFLIKTFRRLNVSNTVINVGLLIITNLPMVLMLSSAINNDAVVFLGMAIGLWLLVRLWQQPKALDLAWLINLAVIGGLFKRTLLPLGLLFGLLGLIVFIRQFKTIWQQLKKPDWRLWLAGGLIVLSLGLFAERVGGNLVRYGGVTVTCEQVHGEAACYDFWLNVRSRWLAKQTPKPLIPVSEFVPRWFHDSFYNIVDIQTQGWRHQVKPAPVLVPFLIILLSAAIIYGLIYEFRRFKIRPKIRPRLYIILICLSFIFVHLIVNYRYYHNSQVFGLALNGRYILPALLPLVILSVFYWGKILKRWPVAQVMLALVTIVFVILGSGLLMMLRNPQLYNG